jgi:Protein of unknown function (DUF1554)
LADTATFEIPLDETDGGVSPGDTVVIAAHAEVEDVAGRAEGAWGEGARFVARGNWAMYFTYAVQEPFLCGGETSKCMFVTSTRHDGDLGGLTGADAICQARAGAAGSLAAPGTYKAWLSSSAAWPADGTRFTQASVPYKLVDGTTIADDWADPTNGDLDALIQQTELGGLPPVIFVWTGTTADGLAAGFDCQGWTTNAVATEGFAGAATHFFDERWSFEGTLTCNESLPLYCFQQ